MSGKITNLKAVKISKEKEDKIILTHLSIFHMGLGLFSKIGTIQ